MAEICTPLSGLGSVFCYQRAVMPQWPAPKLLLAFRFNAVAAVCTYCRRPMYMALGCDISFYHEAAAVIPYTVLVNRLCDRTSLHVLIFEVRVQELRNTVRKQKSVARG